MAGTKTQNTKHCSKIKLGRAIKIKQNNSLKGTKNKEKGKEGNEISEQPLGGQEKKGVDGLID